MERPYVLGLDFGSLSARALLMDTRTGTETASAVFDYPHGVMDRALPNGTPLPADTALQHPQDYLDALCTLTRAVLDRAGIAPDSIAGITLDFTASTPLVLNDEGVPLCFLPEFRGEPHAYVKMWKHHAAQAQAERITELAAEYDPHMLDAYSGRVSSEWLIPKLLQILEEAPEVYRAAARFAESGDWIVRTLTGVDCSSTNMAGYKALWRPGIGYPDRAFLETLNPAFADAADKLAHDIRPVGVCAGYVTETAAEMTGLAPGTPVGVSIIDAHAAYPAAGATQNGKLMMIVGTSNCCLTTADTETGAPGVFCVRDGILPGVYGYEAGQACFGDHFDWFCKHQVPASYTAAAEAAGVSIHTYLSELAAKKKPGETGLLALDWWNGVRTDLMDERLHGVMLGMTLATKPEDQYRALMEGCAFGTRVVLDCYRQAGIVIDEGFACGGIAKKNPQLLQILSDVLGIPLHIAATDQAGALGCAMWAAVMSGIFPTLKDAAAVMVRPPIRTHRPDRANSAVYDRIYALYRELHDSMGKENSILRRLSALRQ